MDLFTDIYNKVMGFFRRTDEEETAKDTACNRLRVVLMQDRTNLNPQLLERMRKELVELLSKYAEPDITVISNVGTAHIGRLGSRENIAKAKCEIVILHFPYSIFTL